MKTFLIGATLTVSVIFASMACAQVAQEATKLSTLHDAFSTAWPTLSLIGLPLVGWSTWLAFNKPKAYLKWANMFVAFLVGVNLSAWGVAVYYLYGNIFTPFPVSEFYEFSVLEINRAKKVFDFSIVGATTLAIFTGILILLQILAQEDESGDNAVKPNQSENSM